MFRLPKPVDTIRGFLAHGMRKSAADAAKRALEKFDADDLRKVVEMFIPEVRERGDERGRGRPKAEMRSDWAVRQLRAFAVRDCRACVLSRRLVDGDELDAEELANAAWLIDHLVPEGVSEDLVFDDLQREIARVFASDLVAARDSLRPYAENLLREKGLFPGRRNPRKGFKTAIQRKIAKHYGLSERQLREELAK